MKIAETEIAPQVIVSVIAGGPDAHRQYAVDELASDAVAREFVYHQALKRLEADRTHAMRLLKAVNEDSELLSQAIRELRGNA